MNQVSDNSAANAILKELYDGQLPADMVYRDHPLFAMIEKKTDFGGKYYPVPVEYAYGQGRSATFSSAQANQSANQFAEFLVTDTSDYALATMSRKVMMQAATDRQSFINYATSVVDGAIKNCTNSISSSLFRSGTGTIGVIGTISSGVITFTDANMVTQFEKNMTLEASATDGGAARAAVGYVIGRNAQAGQITVSATFGGSAGTPSGWTTSDTLRVQGDVNAKIKGLQAWLPVTAPTAGDNHFGVDRSSDSRLYGLYMDMSSQSPEEALVDVVNTLAREGASTDVVITNYTTYSGLIKALGSKVMYTDLKGPGSIGFRGIELACGKSTVKVIADKDCQGQTAYALQLSTWKLLSTGEAPHLQKDLVNGDFLRVYNADQAELRVSFYGNLACTAPGWNAQVKLAV